MRGATTPPRELSSSPGSSLKDCSATPWAPSTRAILSERFPTEGRATASAFCYHKGAIFGGLVAPVLTYVAINYTLGFGIPMLVGTAVGAFSEAVF